MTTAPLLKPQSLSTTSGLPIQDYVHWDDHTQPTYEMTPGFANLSQYDESC